MAQIDRVVSNEDVSWAVELSAWSESLLSANDEPVYTPAGGWWEPSRQEGMSDA